MSDAGSTCAGGSFIRAAFSGGVAALQQVPAPSDTYTSVLDASRELPEKGAAGDARRGLFDERLQARACAKTERALASERNNVRTEQRSHRSARSAQQLSEQADAQRACLPLL